MDKKYWENKEITVHWWNMGSKVLDYKGTYKGYLEKKGIRVRGVTSNSVKGFRFTIPLSSCEATLNIYNSNYAQCCDEAIKIFLSLLGDKAKFVSYNREFFINWR